ncbi:oxygenase MpaB family protein [[Kitasatospora] papulosa]|uniref:oxygenase MpaB family protein n=1 Tax=[Kitasatospora] papulosa TaxID=1464011 RepID=UPI003814FC93
MRSACSPGAPRARRQRHGRRRTVGAASAVPPPRGHGLGVRPSGLRGDPRGRLRCTSTVLATTMHSTADSAWSACERVRAGHARIHGVTDEGVPYRSPTRWNGYIWRRPRASSGPTSGLEQDRWPRGVAVMVRWRCGMGLAGHESTQPVGLGGCPRRS